MAEQRIPYGSWDGGRDLTDCFTNGKDILLAATEWHGRCAYPCRAGEQTMEHLSAT
ncbi:hypothetical protein NITMOv2_0318 [Nitrospira moscoviensis]|uniref:Uncharacterized protein n=1 Tax=Nitrospira moscoviensis TaxID=42253 RepID=A0A0K2G704_NITMO|nr:hypothetical protein NITMOv2_0318 [Nitrospira moscoviensis]